MHKPRTRRQQIAIRSFTYGAMTLLSAIGVVICLAWAMGFRFDFNGGKLTQVGLLQFASSPAGAKVTINGVSLASTTPTRFNGATGKNSIKIEKEGYRPWQKTVNLNASQVLWLDYVRLVPNTITTDSIKTFSSIKEMRESSDKHWLLIRSSDGDRKINCVDGEVCDKTHADYYKTAYSLTLADLSDPKNVRFSDVTIDPNQITTPNAQQTEVFSIVEWDNGSRYVLIKHQVDNAGEYLLIDRQNPTTTKNLTKDFGMDINDPHFSDESGQRFFALTSGSVRKFDYSNKTASAPLVADVESYSVYGDNHFAFVSKKTDNEKTVQKTGVYDDGTVKTIKTYEDVKQTIVGLTRYRNVDYLAVARGETLTIYRSPFNDGGASAVDYISVARGVEWLSFSQSGRFVMVVTGNKTTTFDLDSEQEYSFEANEVTGVPVWIDDAHIIDKQNGRISLVEFDGTNGEDIVSADGYAVLSEDGKFLFSFDGATLQRSKLYVE